MGNESVEETDAITGDKVVQSVIMLKERRNLVHKEDKSKDMFNLQQGVTSRQILYEGKTNRCHPSLKFLEGWDVSHSLNHWSNEVTMTQYLQKILVPF